MEGVVSDGKRLLRQGAPRPQQRSAVDQQRANSRPVQLGSRLCRGVDVQLRPPLLLPLAAACRPLWRRGRSLRSTSQVRAAAQQRLYLGKNFTDQAV